MAKQKLLYQLMARVSLLLGSLMIFVTVFAVWVHCDYGQDLMDFLNNELAPTIQYYDSNRQKQPIVELYYDFALDDNDKEIMCDDTWERQILYDWPGTMTGCREDGKVHRGVCETTDGESIEYNKAVPLSNWRDSQFCVQRFDVNNVPTVLPNLHGKCPDEYTKCMRCKCWRGTSETTVCPITNLELIDLTSQTPTPTLETHQCNNGDHTQGTFTNKLGQVTTTLRVQDKLAYCKRQTVDHKRKALVDVHAVLYDGPCKNPNRHPENHGTHHYYPLLNDYQQYEGCGSLYEDQHVFQIDTQPQIHFLEENIPDHLRDIQDYKSGVVENGAKIHLYGRKQIQAACDEECQQFRFANNHALVQKEYMAAWQKVKSVAHVAGWSSVVLFGATIYILTVLDLEDTTQGHYLFLLVWPILVLFVLIVLMWTGCAQISNTLNDVREPINRMHRCVVDEDWKTLIETYINKTDLTSLNSWLGYLTGFAVVFWLLGCTVLLVVTSKLGDNEVQADREEYEKALQSDPQSDAL